MKIQDVMTKQPTCCTPETSLESVARMMAECDCGAIPVVDDLETMSPLGVITDRDIVVRALADGQNPMELTAAACMTAPAVTVTPDADLDECVKHLEDRQIRRAVVVDNNGRVCGIVAPADIAMHTPKRVVGELIERVSERVPPLPAA
jgi:CBS domain-containing protein